MWITRVVRQVNSTWYLLTLLLHSTNQKLTKTVDSDVTEGGFVWSDSILRQVCHLLLSDLSLSPAVETGVEELPYCSSCLNDPKLLSDHG